MSIALLPEEPFVEIVQHVVHSANDLRADRLTRLRLVRKRWNEVIQSTPSLWTYIWNGFTNTYVEQALERSKPLGLTIRCTPWRKVRNHNTKRFWSAVLSHFHRWDHVKLDGELPPDVADALAFEPTPRLRNFTWRTNMSGLSVIPDPFLMPFPNLESLNILHRYTPWAMKTLSTPRLKVLRIFSCYVSTNSAADLFELLSELPELVQLNICGMNFENWSPIIGNKSINLTHLETFTWMRVLPRQYLSLLESINAPSCRKIVVSGWGRPDEEEAEIRQLWRTNYSVQNVAPQIVLVEH